MAPRTRVVQQLAGATIVVGAALVVSRLAGANAVTAGLVCFVAVLALAVRGGFLAGLAGSLLATVGFNYWFLPPVGTFHIAEAQNWVALACFLIATTIASRLVARERERAAEAESRQREIAALYELCVDLFTANSRPGGLDAAVGRALRTIGARGGGLVLRSGDSEEATPDAWIGDPKDLEIERLLERVPAPIDDARRRPRRGWRNARLSVVADGKVVGHLVVHETRADHETLESVARLVALAWERERLLAEKARIEALRESDALKTSLLRAVSHDLTTPLTSILLSAETLRREIGDRADLARPVELIAEESARLERRVRNLLAMARLEAGGVTPRREPTPAADLFRAVRENLRSIAASRRLETRVAPGCPDLDVDPSLALEILVNLVENAHRASPPEAPIEILAAADRADAALVGIEVLDRGAGLPAEPLRLGERRGSPLPSSSGDTPRRGLGLEIARSFAAALGGEVTLLPREGGGVRASVSLRAVAAAEGC